MNILYCRKWTILGLVIGLLSWMLFESSSLSNYKISTKQLHAHVKYLTDPALNGRLTGTLGEKLATQYVADVFRKIGLKPAGDHGTYFQEFNFISGFVLSPNNYLSINSQPQVIHQNWRPLLYSAKGSFTLDSLTFAGYGLKESYKTIDVKNKWIVVFQEVPQRASMRYKTFIAKNHGAKGIIFIGGENPQISSFNNSNSGIFVLLLSDKILSSLLKQSHYLYPTIPTLQSALSSGKSLPNLNGIKITGQIDIQPKMKQGRNVLGKLQLSSNANRAILIGAHIDHLGHGKLSGSLARGEEKGMIHPGADDNASGVSSLLEIAAKLKLLHTNNKLQGNKDILFAAWSGEELGVLGSSYFVQHPGTQDATLQSLIEVAINLDMVGHLREKLILQGVGSSKNWNDILKNIKTNLNILTQKDPYLPTDSTSFYLQNIPTLNVFTGAHVNYHTPRDTAETLNYAGIKTISNFLIKLVVALETPAVSLPYQKIERAMISQRHALKLYLGTIPDYAAIDNVGVKISGVAKDSPAEKAGLQTNDIILGLANKKINNIYDYTYALNSLPVGKPVKVLVSREHKKILLNIEAHYR